MPRESLTRELDEQGILLPNSRMQLALKINQTVGAVLPDNADLRSLLLWSSDLRGKNRLPSIRVGWKADWREVVADLTGDERHVLVRAVGSMARQAKYVGNTFTRHSLGEVRDLSVAEMVALENIGPIYTGFNKIAFERDLGFSERELKMPGEVEELVRLGRIPLFENWSSGGDDEARNYFVLCSIPPAGVSAVTDFQKRLPLGVYEFVSPEGEVKGRARTLEFTPEEAEEIKRRREQAVKQYYPDIWRRTHPWHARWERVKSAVGALKGG